MANEDVDREAVSWAAIARMKKTKLPEPTVVRAALDNDDVFILEEMRLRLECLRLANVIDENNDLPTTDTVLRRAKYYWRFVSDAEAEETPDADA